MTTITKGLIGDQDINRFDGTGTNTFSRVTSSGATLTLNKVGYEVYALSVYGAGNAYTDATITSALSAISTNECVLVLEPGTWVISQNIDWSSYTNVIFKFSNGAVLSHGAYTVNIPNVDAGLYQIFDGTGTITLSGNVKEVYPEWWGIDGTDDDVEINAALSAVGTYGTIYLTQNYSITDEILFTASGQKIIGNNITKAKITQNTASKRIVGFTDGTTTVKTYCEMANVHLYSTQASVTAFDCSGSSYGTFHNIILNPTGASSIGLYGIGNSLGSAPYYNSFDSLTIVGGGATSTAGIQFVGSGLYSADGPNANNFSNIKRITSFAYGVDIQSGHGNKFLNTQLESIATYHFRFNERTADDSGTAESGTQSTLTDTDKAWATNTYANATVVLTGGTGSGQRSMIASNTANALTVYPYWQTTPDSTTTYEIYKAKATENSFTNVRSEGTAATAKGVLFDYGAYGNEIRNWTLGSITATQGEFNSFYNNVLLLNGQQIYTYTFTSTAAASTADGNNEDGAQTGVNFLPTGSTVYGGYVMPKIAWILGATLQSTYRGTTTASGTATATINVGATSLTKTLSLSDNTTSGSINTSMFFSSAKNSTTADGYIAKGGNLRATLTTDASWTKHNLILTVYVVM